MIYFKSSAFRMILSEILQIIHEASAMPAIREYFRSARPATEKRIWIIPNNEMTSHRQHKKIIIGILIGL